MSANEQGTAALVASERPWIMRIVGVVPTERGVESEVNVGPFPSMKEAHDYFQAHRHEWGEQQPYRVNVSFQPLNAPEPAKASGTTDA